MQEDPLGILGKSDPLGILKKKDGGPTPSQTVPQLQSSSKNILAQRPSELPLGAPPIGAVKPDVETLFAKISSAKQKLDETVNTRDDIYTDVVKENRLKQLDSESKAGLSDMVNPALLSARRGIIKEIPVSTTDVEAEKAKAITDPSQYRKILKRAAKTDPTVAVNAYIADAEARVSEKPEIASKVLQNADKIASGELNYNVSQGVVQKPEGTFMSLYRGLQERNKQVDDYDFLTKTLNDAAIISQLEDDRSRFDPDEPMPTPEGTLAEFGQMLGMEGVPIVKGAVAGVGTALIPGAQAAAPYIAAFAVSPEYYQRGYSTALRQAYNEFRSRDMPEYEALEKARAQAEAEANLSAAEGFASGLIGGKIGFKPSAYNFSGGYKNALKNVLKGSKNFVAENLVEGGTDAAIAGGLQIAKNIAAIENGLNRDLFEGVQENVKSELGFTFGLGGLISVGKAAMDPKSFKTILTGVARQPKEFVDAKIGELIVTGQVSPEQAQETGKMIDEARALDSQIPSNVTDDETRSLIAEKIEERNKLKQELATSNEAFHADIKNNISEIDKQILSYATTQSNIQEGRTEGDISQYQGDVQGQPEVGQGAGQQGQTQISQPNVGDSNIGGQAQVAERITPEQIQVTNDATGFSEQVTAAKESLGNEGLSVSPYEQDEYDKIASEGGQFLRAADNQVLALLKPNGEMVSLVKAKTANVKGAAQALITKMKDMGGLFMDNYDIYLTPIYEKAGYKVAARVPFNEQYAPEGWNAEDSPLKTKPDVVFMVRQDLAPADAQTFENYDDAQAFTQGIIDNAVSTGKATLPSVQATTVQAPTMAEELQQFMAESPMDEAIAMAEQSLAKSGLRFKTIDDQNATQGLFKSDSGEIVINKAKLADDIEAGLVVWHEASHPVMNIIRNTDKTLYDAVVRGLQDAAKKNSSIDDGFAWAQSNYSAEKLSERYKREVSEEEAVSTQNDEALAEIIGRINAGLIDINSLDTGFKQKLIDFINEIAKFFGIDPIINDTDVAQFKKTVSEVADALQTGRDIAEIVGEENVFDYGVNIGSSTQLSVGDVKGTRAKFNASYPLSFVRPEDKINIMDLVREIESKGQKVWFWVADQLGRGMYYDKVVDGEHYLDAGPSFALDPKNRSNNIIWATGKGEKWVKDNIAKSDYIFIISGSPTKSKLFNKRVSELTFNRIKKAVGEEGAWDKFKSEMLAVSKIGDINKILDKYNSFEELLASPDRKQLLIAIDAQKDKKGTPLKGLLEKYGALVDYNDLRDGFYKDNDFKLNDIMLVLKPTGYGGKSEHSTYENDILGEVVGVPDMKVNAFDIMPEDFKSKYKPEISRTEQSQAVAPYGSGIRNVQASVGGRNIGEKELAKRTNVASEKLKTLFNRDNIPLTIDEAKEIVGEVVDWSNWYDGISSYAEDVFGEYAEDFLSLLPLSSQAANSATTVALAIGNAERVYKGENPVGVAEYYGYVSDFLGGKGIKSDKMYNFFKALTGDKNAVAVDMHVWSLIMGKDPNKKQVNPKNQKEFDRAKQFVNVLADELGLAPREVQASLWAANILRTGGKPDSYEEYIEKQIREKDLEQRIQGWRDKGYKPFSEVRKRKEAQPQLSAGNRLAPNGKPSKLNAKQYEQVRTPEFKNWFGDWENDPANASKVVDENGEPRVVFHGTNNTFDEFKKEKLGSKNFTADSAYMGFFFAGDRSTSEEYTGMNSMDMMGISLGAYNDVFDKYKVELDAAKSAVDNIYKDVFARVEAETIEKNLPRAEETRRTLREANVPVDYIEELIKNLVNKVDTEKVYNEAKVENDRNGNNQRLAEVNEKINSEIEDKWRSRTGANPQIMELFLNIKNPLTVDYSNIEATNLASDIQEAIGTGKDGVIFNNLKDGDNADDIFVALEPNQIKSATGNVGTFSTQDNRIQFSAGNRKMVGQINWEVSPEGKGDPSISARNPVVVEAAKNLKEGKITNEEYRATVSANSPITPITRFFEPATEQEIRNAFSVATKKDIEAENIGKPVDQGKKVGLRLDIPSYKFNNTWVVSVHEGHTKSGKIISYGNVARINNVTFEPIPLAALNIATGDASKTSVARMYGEWVNIEGNTLEEKGENAKKIVQDIVDDPSYVQVGMNPFRYSYFYDRSTDIGRPIVSADEVVQIGGLVYAKNPVYGNWTDEAYRVKGLMDSAGQPVQFSAANRPEFSKDFKLGAFVMRKKAEGASDAEIAGAVASVTQMSKEEIDRLISDPEQFIRDSFPSFSKQRQDNLIERAKMKNIYRGRQFGKPIDKKFVGLEIPRNLVDQYMAQNGRKDNVAKKIYTDFKKKWLDPAKGLPDWVLAIKDFSKGTKNIEIARAAKTLDRLKAEAKRIGFQDWDAFSKAMVVANNVQRFIPQEDGIVPFDPYRAYEGRTFTAQDDELPALVPDEIKALPEEIIPYVYAMRGQIDRLTKDLIGSGYVTPDQAVTLERNIGQYVNRAYRLFNERGYKPEPEVLNAAVNYLANEKFQGLLTDYFKTQQGISSDKVLTSEEQAKFDQDLQEFISAMQESEKLRLLEEALRLAQADVNAILEKKTNPYFGLSEDKRDVGILQNRKDISEPIRKLMGEYTDPGTTFMMTVAKQAALKGASEYLTKLREFGMGTLFFEAKDPSLPASHSVQVASTGTESMSPLGGLYTTPEIYEAIQSIEPTYNAMTQAWMKLVGSVRWGKTVGSVATQFKNFESNLGFAVLNGLLFTGNNGEAFRGAAQYVKGQYSKAEIDALTEKLIKLNLVGQSVGARELKEMLGGGDLHDIALDIALSPEGKWGKKVAKRYNVFKEANKLYRLGDDFWKAYAYLNERQVVARGRFEAPYESLTKEQQEQVDLESSERVKNTWPTYDRVVEGAKIISKSLPIFGNFISFQAESLRVLQNSVKLAMKDMRDPQMKSAGMKRMAGIVSYFMLRSAITIGKATAAGMAASGVIGALIADDDEERRKNAIKQAAPVFMRSGDLATIQGDQPHKFTIVDMSSLDPYGIIPRSLNAFTDGREGIFGAQMEPGVMAAGTELFSSFLEPEMTFSTMWSTINNTNPKTKQKLVLENDTDIQAAAKVAGAIWDQLEPSTIALVKRAFTSERPAAEVLALFGARPYEIDLHKSFSIILSKAGEDLSAINTEYNRIKYNEKATPEEKASAEKIAEDKKAFAISKLNQIYRDFILTGADPNELNAIINQKSAVKVTGYDPTTKKAIKTGNINRDKLFK
jgi:ADP-Ribosyltransferase in polyvalent proteins